MGRGKMDYVKLYEAGVKAGHGTENDRATYREIIRTWEEKDSWLQLEQMSMSTNSRSVVAEESGHNVHLTQPEVVADATRWALGECLRRGSRSGEVVNEDRGAKDESRAVTGGLKKRPPKGHL
jgi:hypothetical protein